MFTKFANKWVLRASLLAAASAVVIAGAAQVGCSGTSAPEGNGGSGPGAVNPAPNPGGATGTVGFSLTLPGGTLVSSVTYDLTNGGTAVALPNAPNPGTVAVNNSNSIDFQLGGVPAATGYSISITATTSGGGTCQGSASGFTITAGATLTVQVQMLCSLPGQDAGNLFVTGVPSYCGTWTSLSTNSSEAYVGESIVLTATATGDDPVHLGYTWTMNTPIGALADIQPDGGVGSPAADENYGPSDAMSFMCTTAGTTTVTVTIDDGPQNAGTCSNNVVSTTVICDAVPSNQAPYAWVELAGPNSVAADGGLVGAYGQTGNLAIARAVTGAAVDGGNPCPNITINSGTPVQMNLRAAATTALPARTVNTNPMKPSLFPVSSCEYPLPSNATSASVAGQSLPIPKANPQKIVVIGDVGCRLQNNNGTQSCNDTNPNGTDTPYPFAAVASLAAAQSPDLVLTVGDWDYRDNPCPPGLGFNCGGSPWGFGWDTWEADVFSPAAPLFAAAPWIMTRGNHEQCNRAGQGWYRFLDTQPYDLTGNNPYDVQGGGTHHTCDNPNDDIVATGGNWNNPFLVQINPSTQVLVFDTSNAKIQSTAPTLPGGATGTIYTTTYANELTLAGNLVGASPDPFNLWASHHPIFGYATGSPPTSAIPTFPVVMNSVYPNTYFPPPINLALHGHTHDYQAISMAPVIGPDGGPFQPAATLVSGNAGDILDSQLPYPLPNGGSAVSNVSSESANPPVYVATVNGAQQFATSDNGTPYQNTNIGSGSTTPTDNSFGYMVLQFNAGSPPTWTSTEYRTDGTVRDVCTVQTTGVLSCSSWGIVQPNGAGVY
jgi:hypothetical protein